MAKFNLFNRTSFNLINLLNNKGRLSILKIIDQNLLRLSNNILNILLRK